MSRSCLFVSVTFVIAGIAVASALADPPSPGPVGKALVGPNRGLLASPRMLSPVGMGNPSARRHEARIVLAPQAPAEGSSNPLFPPGCVFFEDYSEFQIGPLPFGDPIIQVADDAFYKSIGGVPPIGNAPNGAPIDRYLLFARRTLNDAINTDFALGANVVIPETLFRTIDAPLQVSQLVYMPTVDGQPRTSLWWSPVSFVEGTALDRVFFGGTNIGGLLEFGQNELGVLDRFISLGPLAPQSSQFFGHPLHPNFPFPVDQWFTIMLNQSQNQNGNDGQSTWIKSNDTVTSNPPFIDPRMASGDIVAPDGDPVGWVNTYPGHVDDPATRDVIEGIGIAATQFNEPAQTNGAFEQAPSLAATPLDGVQLGIGLDPSPSTNPNFTPNDYLFGPACFSGRVFIKPCPIPDFTLAYTDDLEDWTGGAAIQLQGDRWADGVESEPTYISHLQNTTPGGSQSIASQNFNNDDLFRLSFKTALPTRAVGQIGAPLVVSSQVRVASSTRTTRAVALRDSQWEDDVAAWVFLGGTDPTDDSPIPQGDAMVYVRHLNPAFDPTMPAQDDMVQANWIDPTLWVTPPDPPLNLRYMLVPTGAMVPAMVFQEVRLEIEPDPADPDASPTLRVFYGGVELFPNGDSSQQWAAGSRTADSLEFWSGNEETGQFDVIHVDDVHFDGPRQQVGAGPLFMAPYIDGFESYTPAEPIDAQGDTPFLDPASLPVGAISQNAPQLAIVPSASTPAAGDPVCRYQLTEVCEDEQGLLPPVDSVIAMSLAPVPPLAPGAGEQLCPGFSTNPLLTPPTVEVRTPDANVRVAVAGWQLLNDQSVPTPFDPLLGDETGFEYLFTFEPRWRVVTPMSQAQIATDPADATNQVLRLVNPGAIDGSANNFPLFDMVSANLPHVQANAEDFPFVSHLNEVQFDLYIESVDENGQPVLAAPKTRLSLPINSAEPDSGLITEIIFGGPNTNAAAEDISYRTSPNNDYATTTNVSLLTGGMGVTGPLVNTWFRVVVQINEVGEWTLFIDEDRDGPLAPVAIAQGNPLSAHDPAGDPPVDLSRIASFELRQGRDVGGDGEPTSQPPRAQIKHGAWRAIGPSDAAQNDDYCFYETLIEEFKSETNPPTIADVTADTVGEFTGIRELGPNNDVIAVLNKRTNADNTVVGMPLLHDPCPTVGFNTLDSFELLSQDGSEVVYRGRWGLDGLLNAKGMVVNPPPAGGISRPDGMVQNPRVSYNDPLQEPPGFPATIAARPIILADWAFDAHDGVSPVLTVAPASRWFVDNLSLRALEGRTPCADIAGDPTVVNGADLSILLVQWGPEGSGNPLFFNEADYNNDGVINGFDLATLLTNWGPCP